MYPIDTGLITPFGESAPGSSASTHNLSVSSYNYQVTEIGYRVYTDKWFTGASSLKVTVTNWNKISGSANSNKLTIAVVNSSGSVVASKTIDSVSVAASHTFTGLSSTSKYYVYFQVPTNNNIFSFNGVISKAN